MWDCPCAGWLESGDDLLEVVIVVHHIAFDGGSAKPFAADLVAAFAARREGSDPVLMPLPVQYADYALWQERVLGDAGDPDSVLAAQMGYWMDRLADAPEVIDLPMDRPRPAVMDPQAAMVSTVLARHHPGRRRGGGVSGVTRLWCTTQRSRSLSRGWPVLTMC